FNAVGDLVENLSALGGARFAPGGGRRVGSVEGRFDVLGRAAGNLAKGFAGDGRDVLKVLAFDGRYPFAADVVLVSALKIDQGIGLPGCGVDGHGDLL